MEQTQKVSQNPKSVQKQQNPLKTIQHLNKKNKKIRKRADPNSRRGKKILKALKKKKQRKQAALKAKRATRIQKNQKIMTEMKKDEVTGGKKGVARESVDLSVNFAKHFLFKSFDNKFLEQANLHIDFPFEGTNSDCVSSGSAIVTALVSLALNLPVLTNTAILGEISLNGKILKVEGILEKILAAKREGFTKILLPVANSNEVKQLKNHVREGISFVFVAKYVDVFAELFKEKA